jgi:hypothetical protein
VPYLSGVIIEVTTGQMARVQFLVEAAVFLFAVLSRSTLGTGNSFATAKVVGADANNSPALSKKV